MNVVTETTHWLSPKALSNQTGIPYRTLWRLLKSGESWKGWVVMRRNAEMYDNPSCSQEYVWRAMRLGEWRNGRVVGDLKIPAHWFGGLALIKNGHNTLKDLRGIENDLCLLRSGEVSGALNEDRIQAIANIEEGVSVLTRDGDFEGLARVEQILGLFEPFEGRLQMQVEAFEKETVEEVVKEPEFAYKNLLIVGGKPSTEKLEKIKKRLEFDLVEWALVYGESNNAGTGYVRRVENCQYDVVLLLTAFMGHEHYNKFKLACKESETPYTLSRTLSVDSFETALLELSERESDSKSN